jgi:hypothetical protein
MNHAHCTCLNGYWDFLPVFDAQPGLTVPQSGWIADTYLVPSLWTRPLDAVRKKGERYYHQGKKEHFTDEHEFLYDSFEYPCSWSATHSAWVRRTFSVDTLKASSRYFLLFEGVLPKSRYFVNGAPVGDHDDPTLPLEIDITEQLHAGVNEIAVLIDKYDRNEGKRILVPGGNGFILDNAGIWQDVFLIERGDVYVEDVTIVTSVRKKSMTVRAIIHNSSDRPRATTLAMSVSDWRKGKSEHASKVVKRIPEQRCNLRPRQSKIVEITVPWPTARLWYPEQPHLYVLSAQVREQDNIVDSMSERFGFREVWVDGPKIILNDYPLHIFSDWGHKASHFHLTEEWIRKWFGMLRDANMNHSRLHAHPHPRLYLDLADEEGILITNETAIFGAGKNQASEDARYWENARRHVQAFVKRDKNHPSLILWSVENEMRWNEDVAGDSKGVESNLLRRELPKLRELFNQLDPTRVAYHDGDTTLWNEGEQVLLSRHYGKGCSGYSWWDRKQPLLSSEMCWYHQMGPNTAQHLGGDKVWADFSLVDDIMGRDMELIAETGRTLGVTCYCPWNVSCMTNLRSGKKDVKLAYRELTGPGVKPLIVHPYASEFEFWKKGKGYVPHNSFLRQTHAFRPFAVIDTNLRTLYYAKDRFRREITAVNDTPAPVQGIMESAVLRNGAVLARRKNNMRIARGERATSAFICKLPEKPGRYEYRVTFSAGGKILDSWKRTLRIFAAPSADDPIEDAALRKAAVAFYRAEDLCVLAQGKDISCRNVPDLSAGALAGAKVLVIGKNAIEPGSNQNTEILSFVRKGGRVVVFEQRYSLFPAIALESKPVLAAHIRAPHHPIARGFSDDDFFAWGDDPYPAVISDSYVAESMYRKNDCRETLPILESGEGSWGRGDMEYTPLFEHREGDGLIIACQIRVTDKIARVPTASRLFWRLLGRAAHYTAEPASPAIVVNGARQSAIADAVAHARAGGTVIVNQVTRDTIAAWSKALGVPLKPKDVGDVHQAVRKTDDPLLDGVCNDDTFAIETYLYRGNGENFTIGNLFFAPAKKLDPLLVTPTRSLQKELHVHDGHSELRLGYTISRFMYDDRAEEAIVLGRIRIGSGMVVLNQFSPPFDKRIRFQRLANRLMANGGLRADVSILDGKATPPRPGNGTGLVTAAHFFESVGGKRIETEFHRCCQPTGEEHVSKPILNISGWTKKKAEQGEFGAGTNSGSRDIWIYYHCVSPRFFARPDPDHATALACSGEGRIELFVNSKASGSTELRNGTSIIDSVNLAGGFNHVLIRWKPLSEKSTLKMQWQDRHGRPESGFEFLTY